jgi:hypothetical protein
MDSNTIFKIFSMIQLKFGIKMLGKGVESNALQFTNIYLHMKNWASLVHCYNVCINYIGKVYLNWIDGRFISGLRQILVICETNPTLI